MTPTSSSKSSPLDSVSRSHRALDSAPVRPGPASGRRERRARSGGPQDAPYGVGVVDGGEHGAKALEAAVFSAEGPTRRKRPPLRPVENEEDIVQILPRGVDDERDSGTVERELFFSPLNQDARIGDEIPRVASEPQRPDERGIGNRQGDRKQEQHRERRTTDEKNGQRRCERMKPQDLEKPMGRTQKRDDERRAEHGPSDTGRDAPRSPRRSERSARPKHSLTWVESLGEGSLSASERCARFHAADESPQP